MQGSVFYKRIGARLQRERENQKLSREQLAERSNISAKFLYEIETGRKGFSCIILYRICRALHVKTDYILEGRGDDTYKTRIECMTRNFSPEEMEYLTRMIEGICMFRDKARRDDESQSGESETGTEEP